MIAPRTPETNAAYEAFKQTTPHHQRQQFNFATEHIIREFTHWCVIKNRFPYDTMVRVNDLLVLKRPVSARHDLSDSEAAEYQVIMEILAEEDYYDAVIENFPRVQSVTKHVHVHLVCWHHN